ncbi:MAG: glycosyltransferase family 2 protein [Flavobacterium sp.]|nr:glycosyltransferase family 2 protein [Flavobacterium sp.]
MSNLYFSMIICCYNSSTKLPKTLQHISNLNLTPDFKVEIILVDNNSIDNTAAIALQIWNELQSDLKFKITFEPKPGLSFARNKGVQESQGNYVLFCDDDNWLDEDYLINANTILNTDSKIGMLGGIGYEVSNINFPDWFKNEKLTYAVGPQNNVDGDISKIKGYVYGAGAIVKKELLELLQFIGFENVLTDRVKRNTVTGGGDNEIGYAIVLLGYKIYYSENLKFKHFITKDRLTIKYLLKFKKGLIYTAVACNTYERYIFFNDMQFQPLQFKYIYLSKLFKTIIKYIFGKLSYYEYITRSLNFYNLIIKSLFYSKDDYKIYQKTKSNILKINSYKNTAA